MTPRFVISSAALLPAMSFSRTAGPVTLRCEGSSLIMGTLLLATVLAAPGCLLRSPEITRTRRAFERQYPEA